MYPVIRTLVIRFLLLLGVPAVFAQTAVDPTGHWEGTISVPESDLKVEIDLTMRKGALAGTYAQPANGVKGFPLSTIDVQGRSVRFVLKAGDQPSTFHGELSADGKSMTGTVEQSGNAVPFALTRTGDARVEPTPKSAAVPKALEGTWNGTLTAGPRQMRLIVTIANQPDGTASGTVVSPDGSGVEIPIAIAHQGSKVTIDVPSVGASYAGVVNAAGTELVGNWSQQGAAFPVTFQRAAR